MGFDAYGSTSDMPDPVATAVNGILDHIHAMDKRMEEMCKGLKDLGAEVGDLNLPGLDSCELKHVEGKEIESLDGHAEKDEADMSSDS
jgi:serine O-acetyltransferase